MQRTDQTVILSHNDETKTTSGGIKVRSKSEALIFERLNHFGIDTRYEQILDCGDETVVPDFTFEGADGKLFHLEHMGMMDDEEYVRRK